MPCQDTYKKNESDTQRDSAHVHFPQSQSNRRNQRKNHHRLQGGMFNKQTIDPFHFI
ncbi:hypothetical protein EVA_15856 [gut metagenome]|uniref:Uncharacterized protein n=1 Tax=gut metagenome TaxID=749906 RepID=J9FMB1_9ZZZZ